MAGPGGTIFLTESDDDFPILGDDNSGDEFVLGLGGNDNIFGGIGNDTLFGDAGNDELFGNEGDDYLNGFDGGDRLEGGAGNDQLWDFDDTTISFHNIQGEEGDDVVRVGTNMGIGSVINGGLGYDRLEAAAGVDFSLLFVGGFEEFDTLGYAVTGTAEQFGAFGKIRASGEGGFQAVEMTLYGIGGPNFLDLSAALAGAAGVYLTGSFFDDTLITSEFADIVDGSFGDDTIEGGLGDDFLIGNFGNDTVSYASAPGAVRVDLRNIFDQDTGAAGNDILAGFENVRGGGFNDTLTGDSADNFLHGEGGDDLIFGLAGEDNIRGGDGVDRLKGGFGNDIILGDGGNDVIEGGAGLNILRGGAGNDTFYVEGGGDHVIEAPGEGTDLVYVFASTFTLDGGSEVETIIGRLSTSMTLTGNELANRIDGNAGGDVLRGGLGNDLLDGKGGVDTADYADAGGALLVDLRTTGLQNTLAAGTDRLLNIENVTGGAFNDTLDGNAAANVLSGGGGDDLIYGFAGNDSLFGAAGDDRLKAGDGDDVLRGGLGRDSIEAGAGNDTIVYATADFAAGVWDNVYDFAEVAGSDFDTLQLQGSAANYTFLDGAGFVRVIHTASGGSAYIYGMTAASIADQVTYFA